MKKCACCLNIKSLDEFYKDKQKTDGLSSYCRECCKQKAKKYYPSKNRKKIDKEYMNKIYSDPERHKEFKYKKKILKQKYNRTPRGKYWNLRSRAKYSNKEFKLSCEEFEIWFNTQDKTCHYCGIPLKFGGNNKKGNSLDSLTIDRKDNTGPYSIYNIVVCCRKCNTIKGEWFSEKEMIEIANKYFKNK